MKNIVRLALVVSLSISAASIVACSAAPPSTTGSEPITGSASRTGSATDGTSPAETEGTAPPASDAAAASEDGGAPATGGKDVPPSDPTCVATCNTSLKAKCSGDDAFCNDVCSSLPAAELACLVSAPTCEKSEWIRCEASGKK